MSVTLAVMAGTMVAGSLLSAKSGMDAAQAQSDAAKAQANAKRLQANELLKRAKINVERTRQKGRVLSQEQQGQFAAGGVAIGSGSTLAVMNDTMNKIQQSVEDQMSEAKYKANALRAGAEVDIDLAGDIRQAGKTQAFASLLTGAGRIGGMFV